MHKLGQCFVVEDLYNDLIVQIAIKYNINFAFIGPEIALYNGLVDDLEKNSVLCIGPKKDLARIETSKVFSRNFMEKNDLGSFCPKFITFFPDNSNYPKFIKELNNECVVKADGLHGGKGVKVYGDHLKNYEDIINYCQEIHQKNEAFVIEEKLIGEEFSLMSFTDGKTLRHMVPVKDYKRAYELDKGPNTGSMGSITSGEKLWFLTADDIKQCHKINETVVKLLQITENEQYRGILYGSFMKTTNGIKIIEFNCRFGDPECINVLHLLKTNLLDIFTAIINGTLDNIELKFDSKPSVFKYLVPNGYPEDPIKNVPIKISNDDYIYGSITEKHDEYKILGSRTLGTVVSADSLEECAKEIDRIFAKIKGPLFYRKDIGVNTGITYSNSGVDIAEGNRVVENIKNSVESTFNENVISKFGDYSGLIKIPKRFNSPILVSTTDGVGTKSLLIIEKYGPKEGYHMLGKDLVNHCVNDILVKGAHPLFFMDYFASSSINAEHVKDFVAGISEACRDVNCVLLGGETAEMPDIYKENASDLVGTMIGIVDQNKIIDGKKNIQKGDIVIGLPSTGPHTNGYTLIRRILDIHRVEQNILDNLCATHKCYYNDIQKIFSANVKINGMVHITGGGFIENPPRVIPDGMHIKYEDFEFSDVFKTVQNLGNISRHEMLKVFNCGYGMLIIVSEQDLDRVLQLDIGGKKLGVVY